MKVLRIALIVSVVAASFVAVTPVGAQEDDRPNIVVIMTDDQRWNMTWTMPYAVSEIGGKGITFRKAIVTNPLCCPSRASFFSGEYSHNNGVLSNGNAGEAEGGWRAFLPHESNTVATWLDDAGYQTGLFGKYLNYYDDASHVPPGWDRWVSFSQVPKGGGASYYDYELSIDGVVEAHGHEPQDYSTDVLADRAVEFIETREDPAPLFVVYTPFAPHGPATPAPRHVDETVYFRFPRGGAFNEADVSDKPKWLRRLNPLREAKKAALVDRAARQARSVIAVDEAIAQIEQAMVEAGRTNTMYVLFADQGIAWGEHRWTSKWVPYEESIRQLLMVRWDGHIMSGGTYRGLVQHIDLTATFAELAGAATPPIDGVSMVPLFDGQGTIRDHTLTEGFKYLPRHPPTYCAIRTARYKYVRYATGEQEFYDLKDDPFELRNRVYYGIGAKGRAVAYGQMSSWADAECVV